MPFYNDSMNSKLNTFLELSKLFLINKRKLYLVGGSVRDYLLDIDLSDMDCVTDAKPDEVISILQDCKINDKFKAYGSIKVSYDNVKFDITTLRKEKGYADERHPNKIKFIKSLKTDSKRRDFSINAMYLDNELHLYDYHNGRYSLDNKELKMVGNPIKRFEEDPLRIIRALRFCIYYNLKLDNELDKAIRVSNHLVKSISKGKFNEELRKVGKENKDQFKRILNEYSIFCFNDLID